MLHCAVVPFGQSLALVLTAPSAEAVWRLRGDLLASGLAADDRLLALLGAFHGYLDHLATGMSSRDYSQLASKLDISAISGVILERLAEVSDSPKLGLNLVAGAISEGLMALATRQHVKAWEGELAAVHRSAAWVLFDELWRWTEERNPEIEPPERRELIDRLLAPALDPQQPGLLRAALICRLFQILIAAEIGAAVSHKAPAS